MSGYIDEENGKYVYDGIVELQEMLDKMRKGIDKLSPKEIALDWMAWHPNEAFGYLLDGHFDGFHFELEGMYGSWSRDVPLALAIVDHESGKVVYRKDLVQSALSLVNHSDSFDRIDDELGKMLDALEFAKARVSVVRDVLRKAHGKK